MAEMVQTEALIVGAGLAGLNAARVLKAAGIDAVLLDKGRSVGGRMATRRIGKGLADHGAQFFTVRDPEFQALLDEWLADGLAFEWSRGWSDGSLAETRDGHPRYAIKGGMNALAKHLAEGLDVRLNVKVEAVAQLDQVWRVTSEGGDIYHARAVLLTPPVPQALALIDSGRVALSEADRRALEAIHYEPCITAMIVVEGDVHLPAPGAIQRPYAPIFWISDNRRKGISDVLVLTAQASASYSRLLWDRTDEEIASALRVDVMPIIGEQSQIVEIEIKRWRYAQVTSTHSERFLMAEGLPNLVFAGDAFGGPRVEGAVLSGLAAGRALAAALSK
jgi:predicted NAD/FAD-dependent oxidoreductase